MELTYSLVMPISGARFTNQIALVLKLLAVGYKPDVILGTSGGCITGDILLLSGVNSITDSQSYREFRSRVFLILEQLDSSWYLTPWSSSLLMSRIMAVSQGAMFGRGNGESLISGLDVDLDSQPEMWIGTKDRTSNIHQLFCTRSQRTAKLSIPGAIYMNGDLKLATKASVASCAVPTIVPGIDICGHTYCDGGISHASPLGPLSSLYANDKISYHIVYISPVRYNKRDDPHTSELEDDDTWNQLSGSMAGMVRDLHIPDRNNGIRMVGPDAKKTTCYGKSGLRRAVAMQRCSVRSFIEVTPHCPEHLNFIEMKKGDALKSVCNALTRDDFVVRHWYV
ncbi:Hypothetical protein POVR2_LOCUS366 [uncultured virus]|nr:Hypothetical protein POVR2_LOCUS366 [uncultured virus]